MKSEYTFTVRFEESAAPTSFADGLLAEIKEDKRQRAYQLDVNRAASATHHQMFKDKIDELMIHLKPLNCKVAETDIICINYGYGESYAKILCNGRFLCTLGTHLGASTVEGLKYQCNVEKPILKVWSKDRSGDCRTWDTEKILNYLKRPLTKELYYSVTI
jgi:hypothetical protein